MPPGTKGSDNMEEPNQADWTAAHRHFAPRLFNSTWDLIDLPERTPEQEAEMLHMAHASRYHWGQVGGPLQWAIGDWQLARVYAIIGEAEAARRFAHIYQHRAREHSLGAFHLGYACEALARAARAAGDEVECAARVAEARAYLGQVVDQGDANLLRADLDNLS